jgi:hypothetical protein
MARLRRPGLLNPRVFLGRCRVVLPLAGGRGRDRRPNGPAPRAQGVRQAGAVFQQRRTFEAGRGLPGQRVRAAARRGDPGSFRSTGIRLTEMAGIRHHPDDLHHGDVDLGRQEIYVRGKGKDRIVRIDRETARRIDRYLRAWAKHPQAYHARLWLGAGPRAADPRRDLPDDQAARSPGPRRRCSPATVPARTAPVLDALPTALCPTTHNEARRTQRSPAAAEGRGSQALTRGAAG